MMMRNMHIEPHPHSEDVETKTGRRLDLSSDDGFRAGIGIPWLWKLRSTARRHPSHILIGVPSIPTATQRVP